MRDNRRKPTKFPQPSAWAVHDLGARETLRNVHRMLQRDGACCVAQNARLLCNINTLNPERRGLDITHRICRGLPPPRPRRIGQRLPPPRRWPQIRRSPDLLPRRALFFSAPLIDISWRCQLGRRSVFVDHRPPNCRTGRSPQRLLWRWGGRSGYRQCQASPGFRRNETLQRRASSGCAWSAVTPWACDEQIRRAAAEGG